ncbi:ABC transporter [Enterococcus saigonensis]|uniref:ABC transporter n=1 Tax=Enterococcus saigonensis TaxID=1805431 RepID=A0A679IK83_9ENTE|nr:AarF/UbiB family protein [Enterococcus saigonensis]BCA86562.1 ABC transporter [Enterococcus saigonensis]
MSAEVSKKKRLQTIIKIFTKYKVIQNFTQQKNPTAVRTAFEELGPTFIKIGQMLSVRTDLLSPAYIKAFKSLQDNVKSDDFTAVKALLETEWELPLDTIFADFEEKAFASASIGQAHRATLKSGQQVVVKVQHPGIISAIHVDLALFEKAIPLFAKIPETKVIDLRSVLREVKTSLDNETDFLKESKNAERFYKNNNNWHEVKVPQVFHEYCTKKVIVLEFMPGESLRYLLEAPAKEVAYEDVTKKDLKKKIGLLLVESFMKQVFEDGFFHADPHPGNLFFQLISAKENNASDKERVGKFGPWGYEARWQTTAKCQPYRIVYLDFGMMGSLDDTLRGKLTDTVIALYTQDTTAVAQAVLRLCRQEGPFDEYRFHDELEQFLVEYYHLSLKEIDLQQVLSQVIRICNANNLQMDQAITMLIKAFGTLEGVVEELDPELSMMEVLQKFAQKYFFKQFDIKEEAKRQGLNLFKNLRNLPKLPEKISNALDTISNGKSRVNLEIKDQKQILDRLETMLNRIVVALILAAVILSSSLLVVSSPDTQPKFVNNLGLFGYIAAFVTILLLAIGYLYRRFKK